ncbi:hypothetical protein BDZ89DRAFT_1043710 [Hymenopellis radicata]|nr:hypothetical protein BDZ89DRAFT_1043710 [Hymenopellis radicata]
MSGSDLQLGAALVSVGGCDGALKSRINLEHTRLCTEISTSLLGSHSSTLMTTKAFGLAQCYLQLAGSASSANLILVDTAFNLNNGYVVVIDLTTSISLTDLFPSRGCLFVNAVVSVASRCASLWRILSRVRYSIPFARVPLSETLTLNAESRLFERAKSSPFKCVQDDVQPYGWLVTLEVTLLVASA